MRLGGLLVDTITELRATTASAFMVMLAVSSAKAVKAKTGPKIIATTTWVPGEARSRPVLHTNPHIYTYRRVPKLATAYP